MHRYFICWYIRCSGLEATLSQETLPTWLNVNCNRQADSYLKLLKLASTETGSKRESRVALNEICALICSDLISIPFAAAYIDVEN